MINLKKSSRRAKAAEWKQRNETLRECARDLSRAKQFWNVVFQKTAKDVHRAIELWANEQKSETTSDPVAVATTFRDNYERIGADTPPRGNTFCESARRRQDECVAEIARLPRHRGPAGGRINTDELRMLIGRLKYGKAAGIDAITTDLLKVCADNSHFSKKNCIYQRSIEAAPTIFPFLVSGEILSAPLAKAVAACRYATDFVKRHVEAVAAAPVLATREALRHKAAFAPGGDALSGHFWRRCLAPGARLLLAVLPFRRAHNGPLSTSRNSAPPTTESILIHPLKFHSAAARAWFERAAVVSTGRVTTPRPPLLFEYRSPRDGSPATLRHASPRAALANVRQIVHEDSLNTVVQRRQAIAAAVRFALRLPDAVPDVEREFLASTVDGGGGGDGDGDATADIGSFLRRFEAEAVASREPDPPFSFSRSSTGAIPLRDLRPPPPDSEWLAFMAPDRPGSPPPSSDL